jgi:hypothetical protein
MAVTAGSLASLAVLAPAVGAKTRTLRHKPNSVVLTCKSWVAVQVPGAGNEVVPPVPQGSEYGPLSCGKPLFFGVESDSFTVQDSGDITGTTAWYLDAGTVRMTYDLTPGAEDGFSFNTSNYTGKLLIKGGTGKEKGITGSGTSNCTSTDGVHLNCTDTVTINFPQPASSKVKRSRS